MPAIKEELERLTKQYASSPKEHVAIAVWSEVDILERARERKIKITKKQAQDIIDRIDHKHDASIGISWDIIDVYLDDVEE